MISDLIFFKNPKIVNKMKIKISYLKLETNAAIVESVTVLIILVKFLSLTITTIAVAESCKIPAIYNFGDSNSDTGSDSSVFGRVSSPNGITYFGKPSGRYCDGRLIIDFIAEELELPYLSSYLDAIEGNFRHGANFAAFGAPIQPVNANIYGNLFNPLALNIQLLQFQQLKERIANSSINRSRLPRLEDFSKALYTFDMGQNDITIALASSTEDQSREMIPKLIEYLASAIENVYQLGGRRFWIHNTGPIGCLPHSRNTWIGKFDAIGCVSSKNNVAQEFNRLLKQKVSELRVQLQQSLLVYVDIYSAKYNLIREAKQNGFIDSFSYCCEECRKYVPYWNRQVVNETEVHDTPCDNPSRYVFWETVHYTEAANRWVANQIFDGSLSEPPIPISKSCAFEKANAKSNENSISVS
ncbi:GDSL esterase/lipase At5g14450-like isoform X2 [Amaranthus tricolor]|uniref:GDSL esterase/lipase At5g14450-like isoform X2 n=1 Tax=Amaranthus tricolor TaxID=29722 RepID=UPI002583BC88|nr:GDSL esterase/lipase At5g14450-like isoform X2 [Amaranthus tricolor]